MTVKIVQMPGAGCTGCLFYADDSCAKLDGCMPARVRACLPAHLRGTNCLPSGNGGFNMIYRSTTPMPRLMEQILAYEEAEKRYNTVWCACYDQRRALAREVR